MLIPNNFSISPPEIIRITTTSRSDRDFPRGYKLDQLERDIIERRRDLDTQRTNLETMRCTLPVNELLTALGQSRRDKTLIRDPFTKETHTWPVTEISQFWLAPLISPNL